VVAPGTTTVVTIYGGSIQASVTLPPGAFASTVTVTLAVAGSFPAADGGLAGTGVGIQVTVAQGLQPARTTTISVTYTDAQVAGLDESRLVLARYDEASGRWVRLTSSADASANRVTGVTDHFSLFQLMEAAAEPSAVPPPGDLASVRIYPNPFYPNRGQSQVTLDGLPAATRVRIYTLLGELVWEGAADGAGVAVWMGVNRAGMRVASDVYRARIDSQGKSRTKKLSVIR
jgi:hypothetical protein